MNRPVLAVAIAALLIYLGCLALALAGLLSGKGPLT